MDFKSQFLNLTQAVDKYSPLSQEPSSPSLPPTESEVMKEVINFLKSNFLISIITPLQGTSFQVTKDESRVVFSSVSPKEEENLKIKESRLAVIDLTSEEIIADQKISFREIWAITLSNDDRFIYAGGADYIIFKFKIEDLTKVDEYKGHKGDIRAIKLSLDDAWMYTMSEDGTLRFWPLDHSSNSENLIKSNKKLLAMDLSIDESLIAAGGEENILFIYEFSHDSSRRILRTISNDSCITSCKISKSKSVIILGDEKGQIKVFELSTNKTIQTFSMSSRINSLDISKKSDVIISGSLDSKIKLFSLKDESELEINSHKDSVTKCSFIKDDTKIISISYDRSIKIFKIPEPENEIKFYSEKEVLIKEIWFSESSDKLFGVVIRNNKLFVLGWNLAGELVQDFQLSESEAAYYNYNCKHNLIFSAKEDKDIVTEQISIEKWHKIELLNMETGIVIKSIKIQKDIQRVFIPNILNYYLIGVPYQILILNSETLEVNQAFYCYGKTILEIITDKYEKFLFVAGPSHLMFYSLTITNEELIVDELDYRKYQESFNSAKLCFTDTTQYLYFLTSSMLEIILIPTFSTILKINEPFTGLFQNIHKTIFVYSDNFIKILSKDTFQELTCIRKNYKISYIAISKDSKNLFICTANKIIKIENPLNPLKTTLVGDQSNLVEFQVFLSYLFDKNANFSSPSTGWLVEPAHVNLLHVYSYLNMHQLLKSSISGFSEIQLPLFHSRDGFSPLSIAIQMNYIECIHSIIRPLVKKVKKINLDNILPQLLFKSIENDLIALNTSPYDFVHKVYKYSFISDHSGYLPNCCSSNLKLPKSVESKEFFINIEEFGLKNLYDFDKVKSIVFKKSLIRMNLEIGSKKSLEFMTSLQNCENFKVFETDLISLVLNEKWKKIQKVFILQAIVYYGYLCLLSLYIIHERSRNKTFLVAPFIVNIALYLYEIIFVLVESFDYFKNFWNVIDTFRSLTMIIYSILVWSDYFNISIDKNEKERYMMAILIFISWVRGITYFRIFKKTRYLVKLFFKVLYDILPFLFILFYSILAFALVFRSFESDQNEKFFNHLTNSYIIIIGSWDFPKNPNFDALIVLFATMLNPIITLNLLIAIMGDTYNEVKENEPVADSQELLTMIVEIETLMYWKREINERLFLHIITEDIYNNYESDKVLINVKKIKSSVSDFHELFLDHDKAKEKLKGAFNDFNEQMKDSLRIINNQ